MVRKAKLRRDAIVALESNDTHAFIDPLTIKIKDDMAQKKSHLFEGLKNAVRNIVHKVIKE